MDVSSAAVSFGSVNYPPWTKKWLRWELYTAVEQMAENQEIDVPIPPELLEKVQEMKANAKWARPPKWDTLG
eukprot:2402445-Pleurochrysis_carterae.AAC.1